VVALALKKKALIKHYLEIKVGFTAKQAPCPLQPIL
jgi:hypothetical protein